ncbi:MAG: PPOX class F420-dependent oxidoreductase [Gammaproteobacteria bacterium]|nr:PPOX class F420-dependent oxidoreductase [Gammaproteobacteria bacterium]
MEHNLDQARYISLATFRKSGESVATPVWFAQVDDAYYVFSAGSAGKVKRLRNSGEAKVATCDMAGKLEGQWYGANAILLNDPERSDLINGNVEEIAIALDALRSKYGLQMRLADWGAKLTGKYHKRAYIRFTLNP